MKNILYAVAVILSLILLLAFMDKLDHPDRVFDEDKEAKKEQAHKLANSLNDLRNQSDAMLFPIGVLK